LRPELQNGPARIDVSWQNGYFQGVKVREAITLVQTDGWYLARTRGSHRHFKHPKKPGIVTIAGHLNVDIPRGTLNSVLKQAGLKND
jgi:predicted RNA binding protein YcfA (HicA-like mRNA interferase family)